MRSSLALALVLVSGLLTGTTSASASTWVSSGPSPAQISAVGFDATQPGVVYVGTAGGGVLRSSDGGVTWARTAPTGDDRIAGIDARGGRVVVSRAGGSFSGVGGILRSFDNGGTWAAAGTSQGIANTDVAGVAIDPATPDTVLLGTNGGLFRSTNAGASWNPVSVPTGTQIYDVLFDPAVPGRVFVSSNSGVAVSADHGASFSLYNQGLGSIQDADLALDGGTLYAVGFGAAVRTPTAGAAAWTDASNGLSLGSDFAYGLAVSGARLLAIKSGTLFSTGTSSISWSGLTGPGFAVSRFVADPTQTTRVMAAGDGLARSLDSGATWDRVDATITGLGVTSVTALASRSALLATPTGLQRSDDLGATFTRSSAGLTGEIYGRPAADPSDPSRVFAFASGALFGSTDGGRNWSPRAYGNNNYDGIIAVAPSDGQRLYAAGFGGAIGFVRRSINGGQSWSDANSNGADGAAFNFARGLAVDQADARIAYLSTTAGMRITSDGGDHWAAVSGLPSGDTGTVAADPTAPGIAYVIAADKIWRTTDHGASWAATSVLPSGVPLDVLIDPRNAATLYAATDVGVFRSQDSGASWTAFSDGLLYYYLKVIYAAYFIDDPGLPAITLTMPVRLLNYALAAVIIGFGFTPGPHRRTGQGHGQNPALIPTPTGQTKTVFRPGRRFFVRQERQGAWALGDGATGAQASHQPIDSHIKGFLRHA